MNVVVLIPARMASTRFPGKPLSTLLGKPMIQWVYERSVEAGVGSVIVATDSQRIREAVASFGGEARMTRSDHGNGTERIAEVAAEIDADLVINVQGDEPTIDPRAIRQVLAPFDTDDKLAMATLAETIQRYEDVLDPNVVKVVFDQSGRALYFSRAPIPHLRNRVDADGQSGQPAEPIHFRHIGIYAYRRDFLLRYVREPACAAEKAEGLEQLRALHMGVAVRVALTSHASIGVDTPVDLIKAEQILLEERSRV